MHSSVCKKRCCYFLIDCLRASCLLCFISQFSVFSDFDINGIISAMTWAVSTDIIQYAKHTRRTAFFWTLFFVYNNVLLGLTIESFFCFCFFLFFFSTLKQRRFFLQCLLMWSTDSHFMYRKTFTKGFTLQVTTLRKLFFSRSWLPSFFLVRLLLLFGLVWNQAEKIRLTLFWFFYCFNTFLKLQRLVFSLLWFCLYIL